MDGVVLSYVFDRKGITKDDSKKEILIQIKVYDTKLHLRIKNEKSLHSKEAQLLHIIKKSLQKQLNIRIF